MVFPNLAVPLGPDGNDEVDGHHEAAEWQEGPQDPLGPVPAVLRDVAQPVQGAG